MVFLGVVQYNGSHILKQSTELSRRQFAGFNALPEFKEYIGNDLCISTTGLEKREEHYVWLYVSGECLNNPFAVFFNKLYLHGAFNLKLVKRDFNSNSITYNATRICLSFEVNVLVEFLERNSDEDRRLGREGVCFIKLLKYTGMC